MASTNSKPPRWWNSERKSFAAAWSGLKHFFTTERHAVFHLVSAVAVLVVATWLGLSAAEWLWIGAAITLVLCTEIINSALERVCDLVQPLPDDRVKKIKDLAAAAVLVAACFALLTAGVILLPKLVDLLK